MESGGFKLYVTFMALEGSRPGIVPVVKKVRVMNTINSVAINHLLHLDSELWQNSKIDDFYVVQQAAVDL